MSDKGPLQFERAEFSEREPEAVSCAACGSAIEDAYWEAGGSVACERCRSAILATQTGGSGLARFATATVLGVAGGAVGAGIWYAVRALWDFELGLIAIVVGFLVGGGVRKGSAGRGGPLYQALAVFLTYAAIASTNVPFIVAELSKQSPEGGSLFGAGVIGGLVLSVFIVVFAFAAPFLAGFSNIIGILIIGIALYEAWKINRRQQLEFTGPYRVADRTPSPPAGG